MIWRYQNQLGLEKLTYSLEVTIMSDCFYHASSMQKSSGPGGRSGRDVFPSQYGKERQAIPSLPMERTRSYQTSRRVRNERLIFGDRASPYLAQCVMRQHAEDIKDICPLATVITSSETPGLLAGTMRYFWAKVYFNS